MNTPKEISTLFGCTPAQAQAQFARNAKQLRRMGEQARKTGKKVNGYTAEELEALATGIESNL